MSRLCSDGNDKGAATGAAAVAYAGVLDTLAMGAAAEAISTIAAGGSRSRLRPLRRTEECGPP